MPLGKIGIQLHTTTSYGLNYRKLGSLALDDSQSRPTLNLKLWKKAMSNHLSFPRTIIADIKEKEFVESHTPLHSEEIWH